MANKVSDIRSFLKLGANGIETDVYFTYDGSPTLNYHGFPCDCWRYCFWKERFPDYLNYVRIVRTPGNEYLVISQLMNFQKDDKSAYI